MQTDQGVLSIKAGLGNEAVLLNPGGAGNVGIGTLTPQSKLDVAGTITADDVNVTGTLTVAGLNVTGGGSSGSAGTFETLSVNTSLSTPRVESGSSSLYLASGSQVVLNAPTTTVTSNLSVAGTLDAGDVSVQRLGVHGRLEASEIEVKTGVFPDYVFEDGYKLTPLAELETAIAELGHLPRFPSAAEVEAAGGVELGRMSVLLLEKVEELTLYVIELENRREEAEQRSGRIEQQNSALAQQNQELHRRLMALEQALLADRGNEAGGR